MAIERWRMRRMWDPFQDLLDLQEEVNRLFDLSLAKRPQRETRLLEETWTPAVDLYEDKDHLVFKAELPGLKQEDIEVSIQGDVLTVKGEKKKESEVKESNYYRLERCFGSFQRSITLPQAVDADKVKATYHNGVLEVVMPKKEKAKSKKIQVKGK